MVKAAAAGDFQVSLERLAFSSEKEDGFGLYWFIIVFWYTHIQLFYFVAWIFTKIREKKQLQENIPEESYANDIMRNIGGDVGTKRTMWRGPNHKTSYDSPMGGGDGRRLQLVGYLVENFHETSFLYDMKKNT